MRELQKEVQALKAETESKSEKILELEAALQEKTEVPGELCEQMGRIEQPEAAEIVTQVGKGRS